MALKARVVRSEFQLDSKRDFFNYYHDMTGTVKMYWQTKGTEYQKYPPSSAEIRDDIKGGREGGYAEYDPTCPAASSR